MKEAGGFSAATEPGPTASNGAATTARQQQNLMPHKNAGISVRSEVFLTPVHLARPARGSARRAEVGRRRERKRVNPDQEFFHPYNPRPPRPYLGLRFSTEEVS